MGHSACCVTCRSFCMSLQRDPIPQWNMAVTTLHFKVHCARQNCGRQPFARSELRCIVQRCYGQNIVWIVFPLTENEVDMRCQENDESRSHTNAWLMLWRGKHHILSKPSKSPSRDPIFHLSAKLCMDKTVLQKTVEALLVWMSVILRLHNSAWSLTFLWLNSIQVVDGNNLKMLMFFLPECGLCSLSSQGHKFWTLFLFALWKCHSTSLDGITQKQAKFAAWWLYFEYAAALGFPPYQKKERKKEDQSVYVQNMFPKELLTFTVKKRKWLWGPEKVWWGFMLRKQTLSRITSLICT